MKIAIAAEGSDLQAQVGHRLGTSQYLIIVDLSSMAFEAVPNPGSGGQKGAGIQAVVLAISKGVHAVLTGSCSPTVRRHLENEGIAVVTGISGTVREAAHNYRSSESESLTADEVAARSPSALIDRVALGEAIRKSARQFGSILPILASVLLLVGFFDAFVTKDILLAVFSGHLALDTVWGACFGSILAGNPINSYVIGDSLTSFDVSMFAVTALILTWVTVGWVQLPAEIEALGIRFAVSRNILCFVLSLPTAMITVVILHLIEGWLS